jgi:cytochrome c
MTIRNSALAGILATGLLAACGGEDASPSPAAPASEEGVMPDDAEAEEQPQTASTTPSGDTAGAEAASAQFAGLPAPYASADHATGRRIFMQCSSCHSLGEGGPTLLGPNLYGMFERPVGGLDTYQYSKALQDADFEWTPDQLDQWLASPRNFLPGNKMSFAGVPREDQRVAVIAYVMSETGYSAD